ncbi:MAG: cobalt-precorrin-5B (C(1))-methyltransferase CbiD [Gloeomargarita sp. HHBFW_bins_205]
MAKAGYTLPVFACASAVAALHFLRTQEVLDQVELDLLNPPTKATVPIEQVVPLSTGAVLAMTRSQPGDNLDLTRDTPVWALVSWGEPSAEPLTLVGGYGVGWHRETGQAAIYRYARQLLAHHLTSERPLRVEIILPQGRRLAERTSNAAFGVVEGLALLGTSGIAHPVSAPEQLEQFREELRRKAPQGDLVFCVGENGLDLARAWGVPESVLVKTGNWLGPLLVEAAWLGLRSVTLLGYYGKVIKLAGGIFHTHHHVADGRLEILVACGVRVGLPLPVLQKLLDQPTVEAAMQYLHQVQPLQVRPLYDLILDHIRHRTRQYLQAHGGQPLELEVILFNRERQMVAQTPGAQRWLPSLR